MRGGIQHALAGTIVRPATSTFGSPAPATAHVVEPFASFITPKSDDA